MSNIQDSFNSILSTFGIMAGLSPQFRDEAQKKTEMRNIEKTNSYIDQEVVNGYKSYQKSIEKMPQLADDASLDDKIRHKQEELGYSKQYQDKLDFLRARKKELLDRSFRIGAPLNIRGSDIEIATRALGHINEPSNPERSDHFNRQVNAIKYVGGKTDQFEDFSGDEKKLQELIDQRDHKITSDLDLREEAAAEVKEPLEPQKEIEPNPSQETKDYITNNLNYGQSLAAMYQDYSNKMKGMNKGELEAFYKEKDAFDNGYYNKNKEAIRLQVKPSPKERAEQKAQLQYIEKLENMYSQQDSMAVRSTYLRSLRNGREGNQAKEDIKNNTFIGGIEK